MAARLAASLAGAAALRALVAWCGAGGALQERIEVAPPGAGLPALREALALMRFGQSPYTGYAWHGAPLLLPLLGPAAAWHRLYVLPFILADVATALLLAAAARAVAVGGAGSSPGSQGSAPLSSLTTAALYAWSPFAVLAAAGGGTGAFANAALALALWGGVARNAPAAALGWAVAAYLDVYATLLLVPLALLLLHGPETLAPISSSSRTQLSAPDTATQQAQLDSCSAPAAQSPTPAEQRACAGSSSNSGAPPEQAGAAAAAAPCPPGKWQARSDGDQAAAVAGCSGESSSLPAGSSAAAGVRTAAAAASEQRSTRATCPAPAPDAEKEDAACRAHPAGTACMQRHPRRWRAMAHFLVLAALNITALALLSDAALRHRPEHARASALGQLLRWSPWRAGWAAARGACADPGAGAGSAGGGFAGELAQRAAARHWAHETWGCALQALDLTPNIGQQWYLATEMFPDALPFFRAAFAAAAALPGLALAARAPRRPLSLFLLQLGGSALTKAHPTLSDYALYLALIPLVAPQLGQRRPGLLPFLATTLAALAALGPLTWHAWVVLNSANANFFYAITLAFGTWQVILLVQLVTCILEDNDAQQSPAGSQ